MGWERNVEYPQPVGLLEEHRELVRGCALCFPEGGNAPVVDLPKRVRVMLVGRRRASRR